MANSHIVTAFESELNTLNGSLIAMGHVVSAQLERAFAALRERDATLAEAVIHGDAAVDAAQQAVDDAVVSILALRHPVADDLRLVLVTSKIAGRLERVGDIAANIGKRTRAFSSSPGTALEKEAVSLGDLAYGILADSLMAFAERNVDLAQRVRERDATLDNAYTEFHRGVVGHMMEAPQDVPRCAHLLFIGKNIERVGDHATNIAGVTLYLANGAWPLEERKKGDLTSSLEITG